MEFPEYKKGMTVSEYKYKIEEYLNSINSDKYDVIYDFVEDWLSNFNIKISALMDFKHINENVFKNKKTINRKIYKKHYKKLSDVLNFKTSKIENDDTIKIKTSSDTSEECEEEKSDNEEEEIIEEDLIKLLRLSLKHIDYKLVRYKQGNSVYYSIKK